MENVLVVVDMQEHFKAAWHHKVQENCAKLVKAFRNEGKRIVFLEFVSYGVTITLLSKLVEVYPQATFLSKVQDDGSDVLQDYLCHTEFSFPDYAPETMLKEINPSCFHITICGVNTAACVGKTVNGLVTRDFGKVDVVADACGDNCLSNPSPFNKTGEEWSWQNFWKLVGNCRLNVGQRTQYKNVSLVTNCC